MVTNKKEIKEKFSKLLDDEDCKAVIYITNCGVGLEGKAVDLLTLLDMIIMKLSEDLPVEAIEKSVKMVLAVAKARQTGDIAQVLERMTEILKNKEE